MKLSRLLFPSFFLLGCNTTPPPAKIVEIDNRPFEEQSLIRKFQLADSLYDEFETNEIKKTETYEKQKTSLIKFITDSLHDEAKQWHAIVHEISVKHWPADFIEVTLLIPKGIMPDKDEKYPEYSSIVLSSGIPLNEKSSVKNSLRELSKGDNVLVSGSFQKSEAGDIDFAAYTDVLSHDGDIFTNPKLEFDIKNIVKQNHK
ncbi:hypothetical protein AB6735_21880 [Mucilaginibacter sp. RCC_168]|uniref:hypothetical protein n=1 Tax=Mucilaginibacter sp. RCC_168 TaxID=3239221 RepID=UPI003524E117